MDGDMTAYAFDLAAKKRRFEESRDLTMRARDEARTDRKYYDGKQIDPATEKALKEKRRPISVENHVRLAINGMVGVLERGKTDPRAFPRNPEDEDASDVATKTLRYCFDRVRWHRRKMAAAKNLFIEGIAACIIEVNERLEIEPRRIRYEEFFYDPKSKEEDFSDAAYMGVAKWMDQSAIVTMYPEHEASITAYAGTHDGLLDSTWGDRPTDQPRTWNDPKGRRMLLVEMYELDGGVWHKCVFTGGVPLEHGPVAYVDEFGQPLNPIEPVCIYVDDENNRYGAVRDMRGPQDQINKREAEILALATNRQLQERDAGAAIIDPEEARREAARPDGVIPAGWQIVPTTDMARSQVQFLESSKEFMARLSPNPAVLGREGENASGRNNLVRQQAGLTELADPYGALEDWELRVCRQIWARVRQYWRQPKFIRVTGDEKAYEFVQLNEPVTQIVDEIFMNPMTGERQVIPREIVVGVKNDIAKMGVDIEVDSVPDTANVQQEQFQALIDLARAGFPIPPETLFRASSFPNKREILDTLKPKEPQGPDPAQELAMRGAAAKVANEEAKAGKTAAERDKIKLETLAQANAPLEPITGYLRAPMS